MNTLDTNYILYHNTSDIYTNVLNTMLKTKLDTSIYDLQDPNILTLIGYYYYYNYRDYNTSLIYHNKSIMLPNSVSYIHIGDIYKILDITDQAMKYYDLAIVNNKIGYYNMYLMYCKTNLDKSFEYINSGIENKCVDSVITKIYNCLYLNDYNTGITVYDTHIDLIKNKYKITFSTFDEFVIEYMKISKPSKAYINKILLILAENSDTSLYKSYENKYISHNTLLKLYEIGLNKLDNITIKKIFDHKFKHISDPSLNDIVIKLINKIDDNKLVEYYKELGNLYLLINNHDKALYYLLEYDKEHEHIYVKAGIIYIYEYQNNYNLAIEFLNNTIDNIVDKDKYLDCIKLYINNDIKMFKLLMMYLKKYDNLSIKNMYLKLLNSTNVRTFHNKVIAFTELNNIKDCPVCLEKELNIMLNCGHQVCIHCYPKLNKCFYNCEL